MNHWEAIDRIRKVAKERNFSYEYVLEIEDGTACEGGHNVNGVFQNEAGDFLKLHWDAAFQRLETEVVVCQN